MASTNRKHGRKKRKPSFQRYKASNRAEKRKVRNLVRSNGMTEGEAVLFRERQKASSAANPQSKRGKKKAA